jgi:hypothetical protein
MVEVTATISNPSPDLDASGAHVALTLPEGVELVAGDRDQPLGTLSAGGAPMSAKWMVRGTSDGLKHLVATVEASAYGSTLSGRGVTDIAIDAAGPAVTLAAPTGTSTSDALALAWGAIDPAGVTAYDVEVSLNGAPFVPWLTGTTETHASYVGSRGNRYRFRVRARDAFGNDSPFSESGDVAIATTPPPPPAARAPAHLALTSTARRARRLTVRGVLDPRATGAISLALSARAGRHSLTVRARSIARRGHFGAALRLPPAALRRHTASLTLAYAGDRLFSPQRKRLTIRWR